MSTVIELPKKTKVTTYEVNEYETIPRTLDRMIDIIRESIDSPIVRKFVNETLKDIPEKDYYKEAEALHNKARDFIRYQRDPNGIETITKPELMITEPQMRFGDCDDKTTFNATNQIVAGNKVRLVGVATNRNKPDEVNHVYCEVGFDLPNGETRWIKSDPMPNRDFGESPNWERIIEIRDLEENMYQTNAGKVKAVVFGGDIKTMGSDVQLFAGFWDTGFGKFLKNAGNFIWQGAKTLLPVVLPGVGSGISAGMSAVESIIAGATKPNTTTTPTTTTKPNITTTTLKPVSSASVAIKLPAQINSNQYDKITTTSSSTAQNGTTNILTTLLNTLLQGQSLDLSNIVGLLAGKSSPVSQSVSPSTMGDVPSYVVKASQRDPKIASAYQSSRGLMGDEMMLGVLSNPYLLNYALSNPKNYSNMKQLTDELLKKKSNIGADLVTTYMKEKSEIDVDSLSKETQIPSVSSGLATGLSSLSSGIATSFSSIEDKGSEIMRKDPILYRDESISLSQSDYNYLRRYASENEDDTIFEFLDLLDWVLSKGKTSNENVRSSFDVYRDTSREAKRFIELIPYAKGCLLRGKYNYHLDSLGRLFLQIGQAVNKDIFSFLKNEGRINYEAILNVQDIKPYEFANFVRFVYDKYKELSRYKEKLEKEKAELVEKERQAEIEKQLEELKELRKISIENEKKILNLTNELTNMSTQLEKAKLKSEGLSMIYQAIPDDVRQSLDELIRLVGNDITDLMNPKNFKSLIAKIIGLTVEKKQLQTDMVKEAQKRIDKTIELYSESANDLAFVREMLDEINENLRNPENLYTFDANKDHTLYRTLNATYSTLVEHYKELEKERNDALERLDTLGYEEVRGNIEQLKTDVKNLYSYIRGPFINIQLKKYYDKNGTTIIREENSENLFNIESENASTYENVEDFEDFYNTEIEDKPDWYVPMEF